jgi:hypothetical protein
MISLLVVGRESLSVLLFCLCRLPPGVGEVDRKMTGSSNQKAELGLDKE